jgi:hypothetical protein
VKAVIAKTLPIVYRRVESKIFSLKEKKNIILPILVILKIKKNNIYKIL